VSSAAYIGADYHRAMVATAPGEKLVIGRRSMTNWTRRTISSLLFFCRKLHLFLGKSTKTAATIAALFDFNMHQILCRLGLRPKPHWGSLQRSPDPIAVFKGPTSKGRGGERMGEDEKGGREFALGRKKKSWRLWLYMRPQYCIEHQRKKRLHVRDKNRQLVDG